MTYGARESLVYSLTTHAAGPRALALGIAFVCLVGPIIMPALVRAPRHIFFITRVTVRKLVHFLIDKIIEAIIVLIATFAGWLHYLEAFPALLK